MPAGPPQELPYRTRRLRGVHGDRNDISPPDTRAPLDRSAAQPGLASSRVPRLPPWLCDQDLGGAERSADRPHRGACDRRSGRWRSGRTRLTAGNTGLICDSDPSRRACRRIRRSKRRHRAVAGGDGPDERRSHRDRRRDRPAAAPPAEPSSARGLLHAHPAGGAADAQVRPATSRAIPSNPAQAALDRPHSECTPAPEPGSEPHTGSIGLRARGPESAEPEHGERIAHKRATI